MYKHTNITLTGKEYGKKQISVMVYDVDKDRDFGNRNINATIYTTDYDSIDQFLRNYIGTKKVIELYINGLRLRVSDIENLVKTHPF